MYVVNFDFSDHILPFKILAINIPVIITQLVTYPLQRLQTLLISQSSMITNSQIKEARLIIKNMISIEGFPRLLHGMRYSVDYMATQMTTKFIIFDFLVQKTMSSIQQNERWQIISYCFLANIISTCMSQIAFNYQTIASSLPISKTNRPEDVKIKLQNYTKNNKLPIKGLKYTLPASIINTTLELFVLNKTSEWLAKDMNAFYDIFTAFTIFSLNTFVSHYAFQRQVQICKDLPIGSIPYSKGLLVSLLRYNIKGLTLFSLYLLYFQWKRKNQIRRLLPQREILSSQAQPYRAN